MKRHPLFNFRDWLFNLLMDYLVNSGWIIVIRDFKKSEKRIERDYLGLTDYQKKIIYLDKDCGKNGTRKASRVLVHELCHFAFRFTLVKMAKKLPWKELKEIKGRCRADKEFAWEELRTQEFEKSFYFSLNKRQIKILQGFIDEAQARYRKNRG